MALDLTTQQLEEVQAIQTICKTDCLAISETGERDASTAAAVLEQHEEKVRKVLTAEQYTNWRAWCEDRTTRGAIE